MALFKLYAHEEHEEYTEVAKECAKRDGADYDKVVSIVRGRPLYEVEFVYSDTTGECLYINLNGKEYRPI